MFSTKYNDILTIVDQIDPAKYASSRNYLDGSVTKLSPFLTHGVIDTGFLASKILEKHSFDASYKLIFEIAWRDYYTHVRTFFQDSIFEDLYHPQSSVVSELIPKCVIDAKTGIVAIDSAIEELYSTGYMHNHARMWVASLVGNFAGTHWPAPAAWLYYHLLDGDLASNTLSWQWIVGSASNKKYLFNQDNVNQYSKTSQKNTFVDLGYEYIADAMLPTLYNERTELNLSTILPETQLLKLAKNKVALYSAYTLDPEWLKDEQVDRVLILEPSHFAKFPISPMRVRFILDLAKNIPNIQIFVGEWSELKEIIGNTKITTKRHNHNAYYDTCEFVQSDFMIPLPAKNYRSFMGFWKDAEKTLRQKYS
jgi:deoxyribodipyrimidine photo-lyase